MILERYTIIMIMYEKKEEFRVESIRDIMTWMTKRVSVLWIGYHVEVHTHAPHTQKCINKTINVLLFYIRHICYYISVILDSCRRLDLWDIFYCFCVRRRYVLRIPVTHWCFNVILNVVVYNKFIYYQWVKMSVLCCYINGLD